MSGLKLVTFWEFCGLLGVTEDRARILLAAAGVEPLGNEYPGLYIDEEIDRVKAWCRAGIATSEFCGISEFCAAFRVTADTARSAIACAGVKPVLKMDNACVYRKADIAKVKAWRDSRRAANAGYPGKARLN